MFRPTCVVYGLFLSLAVVLTACTPRSVREAREVVAEADSVWRGGQMYGIEYGDSVTLAEAYQKLDRAQTIFPDEFAHSCYHYGRLLRKKDNLVEAMQAFLNATHSRTRDYHILGRVYSNMGSICHLAGEFQLSYDMYEKSAEMFLRDKDTLSYYFLLNDMAFELAELGEKEKTIKLINKIQIACIDENVLSLVLLTKAALYSNIHFYDSVLLVTEHALLYGDYPASVYALKANALWNTNNIDSALMYAKFVMDMPSASKQDQYNMLYILINGDSTLSNDKIIKLSGDRSDIEFEILNPLHHKLTIAVELLKQDLNRKPNLQWLYASSATILIIGILALVYFRRRHRQHQLLSQQVEDLENKSQEIMREHTTYKNNLVTQLEQNCRVISESKDFPDNLNWKEFEAMCKTVDANFNMLASKLCHIGTLNETEIRLCILVFFDLDRNQISVVLPYAKNGVGKLKYRVAQKLGVEGKNLRKTLIHIAINERIDH